MLCGTRLFQAQSADCRIHRSSGGRARKHAAWQPMGLIEKEDGHRCPTGTSRKRQHGSGRKKIR
ncbi:hypothetical protein ANCCAN_21412 [Ancylostoma caninum]|uniref:Uncharacterized protein n=1 Tax=Ancylostoma caninum TaxID=29170 RepID=A0A368FRE2_ANCCA|nr:hypothetical protein ANCCAN_21412 [Ancylostoma caninum]